MAMITDKFLRPVKGSENCTCLVAYDVAHNTFRIQTASEENGKLCAPYPYEVDTFFKRFTHGYKAHYGAHIYLPTFTTPANDISLSLLHNAWKGKTHYTPAATVAACLLSVTTSQYDVALLRTAQFKETLKNPQPPPTPPENGRLTLKPYQVIASQNAIDTQAYALFMPPGTGKTACAIGKIDAVAANTLATYGRVAQILVVCPKSILYNWENEIDLFSTATLHPHTVHICDGSPGQRLTVALKALANRSTANITVAGYSAMIGTPILHGVQWDLIVLDECHNIADPSTDRSKFCLNILRPNSRHRMILTGTEYRNTPFDIWAQLEFLYSGASGHVSFEKFKQFYGLYAAYTPGGRKELLALNAERVPLLKERIARHSFKVTKEEVLPYLPKKAFDILSCALSKEQSKAYAAVCDSLKLQFETYSGPASLTVSNFLSQMLRLAEITSGYAALDAQVPDAKQLEQILNNDMIPTLQRELYRFDPNPKLDLLVETLLDKEPTQKTQVWCAFRENVKQINARLRLEGIKAVMYYGATSSSDREIAVKSFNCDSDIKVFIGIASAGGVGLNLVGYDVTNPTTSLTNCDHAIYYSMNWSKVDYEQSQDRGHRMTTRVPLRISRLIVPNSIDGQILGRVEDKIEMAKDMSDISAILSKVLNPLGEN